MKRKDLFWMLVPCLLLIGAGVYFSSRPQRTEVKYGVVLDEVKLVPLTPREVALGYDKVVLVKAHVAAPERVNFDKGTFPWPNMKLTAKLLDSKGVPLTKDLYPACVTVNATSDFYAQQATFPFEADDVQRKKALFIEANAHGWLTGQNKGYLLSPIGVKKKLLMQPSKAVKVQHVQKSQPLKIVSIAVFEFGKAPGLELNIHVQLTEDLQTFEGRSTVNLDNRQVIADGKTKVIGGGAVNYSHRNPITVDTFVPFSAKSHNVTFKGLLSVNQCWPMPISVVLRKDGKNITRNEPAL